jgi:hypothetical protein
MMEGAVMVLHLYCREELHPHPCHFLEPYLPHLHMVPMGVK